MFSREKSMPLHKNYKYCITNELYPVGIPPSEIPRFQFGNIIHFILRPSPIADIGDGLNIFYSILSLRIIIKG